MTLETIHESFVNGNKYQAVKQIKEYGIHDFFDQYSDWLVFNTSYIDKLDLLAHYESATKAFIARNF